jgi:hypothetical protein
MPISGPVRYRTEMPYTRMPIPATSASRADAQLCLVYCNYMYHNGFFFWWQAFTVVLLALCWPKPEFASFRKPRNRFPNSGSGISGPYPRLRCPILVLLWLFLKAFVSLINKYNEIQNYVLKFLYIFVLRSPLPAPKKEHSTPSKENHGKVL